MQGEGMTRPLRIAVVTETYPPEVNGVARTIGMMVERLRARGHSIQLVRPRQAEADTAAHGPGLETFLRPGLPLPGYRELRMGLPAKGALLRTWRARRPDVVQVVTEGPLGGSAIAAARRLGIPVVSEFHTKFPDYTRHYGFGLLSRFVARHLQRLHNRADCTLVPTQELRVQLVSSGYRRLAVVGRGVDLTLFGPRRRSAAVRHSWGATRLDVVAAYVGRLAPEKNLQLFLESCRAMQAVAPRLKVVLVGDGPEGAALRAAHPDFVFAGMRSGIALAEHYASADVLLFPSLTETFGNVTTEAMASGLAIVAFDYAAAREHIRHRVSGLLAPFAQPPPFVTAAREAAADAALRARLGAAAAAAACGLTWERVIDDLEGVLRDLVHRSAARLGTVEDAREPAARVVPPETDHASL
jgi:glycosyltransferase involved in cell wall biosynthesis